VPANIVEGVDARVFVANDQDAVFVQLVGEEVTRFQDLRGMTCKQPAPLEYPVEVALMDFGAGEVFLRQ
jgi:hypothetical protein